MLSDKNRDATVLRGNNRINSSWVIFVEENHLIELSINCNSTGTCQWYSSSLGSVTLQPIIFFISCHLGSQEVHKFDLHIVYLFESFNSYNKLC
jgi:hypothetical protein